MTPTQVGMRCPECAKQRTKVMRMRELRAHPRITEALIAINVVAFLAEDRFSLFGSSPANSVYKEGALLGSSEEVALRGDGVAHGQVWRIVTGGFLHENVLHILFNMYVLYVLGQMLEPALGRARFALIYAVALFTGSLGALLVTPHQPIVGASGAVFGVMGAAAVEMRARQIPVMQSGVGGLILINLIISFSVPGISWGGHVGGLIGGALVAAMIRFGDRHRAQALAFAGCVVIAAAAAAGSIATAKSSEVEPTGAGPPAGVLSPGS
jgi:membrane associated rhomboid family serine protease